MNYLNYRSASDPAAGAAHDIFYDRNSQEVRVGFAFPLHFSTFRRHARSTSGASLLGLSPAAAAGTRDPLRGVSLSCESSDSQSRMNCLASVVV